MSTPSFFDSEGTSSWTLTSAALTGVLIGAAFELSPVLWFLALGALPFLVIGLRLLRDARPYPGGVLVAGRVVAFRESVDSEGNTVFREIIEFPTSAGPRRLRSSAQRRRQPELGHEVQLSYPPGAPERVRVLRAGGIAFALMFLLLGSLTVIVTAPGLDEMIVIGTCLLALSWRAWCGGEPLPAEGAPPASAAVHAKALTPADPEPELIIVSALEDNAAIRAPWPLVVTLLVTAVISWVATTTLAL